MLPVSVWHSGWSSAVRVSMVRSVQSGVTSGWTLQQWTTNMIDTLGHLLSHTWHLDWPLIGAWTRGLSILTRVGGHVSLIRNGGRQVWVTSHLSWLGALCGKLWIKLMFETIFWGYRGTFSWWSSLVEIWRLGDDNWCEMAVTKVTHALVKNGKSSKVVLIVTGAGNGIRWNGEVWVL